MFVIKSDSYCQLASRVSNLQFYHNTFYQGNFKTMDNRRINGPEISRPFSIYAKTPEKIVNNERPDGRTSNEIRKMYIKTNVVSQAKGSAYLELGDTKVLVSVFDPREIPNKNEYSLQGELYCEFKFAPFSCYNRRPPNPDAQEKEYSIILKRALESAVCRAEFPNFQVDIYALVLQNDGSALSAAITAAGVALSQAGVPMFDLITCVTIGISENQVFMDPTYAEEEFCSMTFNQPILNFKSLDLKVDLSDDEDGEPRIKKSEMEVTEPENIEHGTLMVSMLLTHQQITEFYLNGSMNCETIERLTKTLIDKNNEIVPVVQNAVLKYVKESLKKDKNR